MLQATASLSSAKLARAGHTKGYTVLVNRGSQTHAFLPSYERKEGQDVVVRLLASLESDGLSFIPFSLPSISAFSIPFSHPF
jgi:hypothetical protein